ncbi:uncharacterized protein LOC120268748 [Dioscorea cayenensis subsp. rotundata]|uniref:Uncharacterized protein LOC120268748 n=1 Tax=Dioscorea cayennensis subsp. rotundata TaxID=55577 RepID=A0AB40BY99_DIOCR|nr:uncharacterized protein LOC120268748 [Dioscorea cayenensis subsp. rotundata]
MEATPLSSSLWFSNPKCPPSIHSSPFSTAFPFQPLIHASPSLQLQALCLKSSQRNHLYHPHHLSSSQGRRGLAVRSSASEIPSVDDSTKWLFEPVGNGDSRHIGYRVPLPGAFEVVSDVVTIGRVPEKADIVIPIATVSGVHAKLKKKEGTLLITDLDSTNGTYINDMRLRPGAVTTVSPGSLITFGDTNLAIFRVSKKVIEHKENTSITDESEIEAEADGQENNAEA